MKKYFKGNLILLSVLVFMSAALVLSGRTEARNLKEFKIASVFTHMHGNFGEPGHDPFWKSRGRRNNSDNRCGNNGCENGPFVGPDSNGSDIYSAPYGLYEQETDSLEEWYIKITLWVTRLF